MYLHPTGKLSRGAVLDVGLKCVHSCKFCYYSYLDGSDDQFQGMRRARFRTADELKETLRRLKDAGFLNFDYTGGEPTLHPDLVELTRYAHQELGLKGRIITLGQFLMRKMPHGKSERLVDDLLEAGLVNFLFSCHAVDEGLFHRITGGRFSLQESAMDHLDARGFHFTTNTTVFEWNFRHLPEIARRLAGHGTYLHNFIVMNAYYQWNQGGRAYGVQARYSEILPYLREAVAIFEAHDVGVNIRYAPMCAVKGLEKHLAGMVGVRYDPYEWMNLAGHFGGTPEQCAAVIPIREGEIDHNIRPRELSGRLETGVEIRGARGQEKLFTAACASCRARPVCDGIDPNYLKQHGDAEFEPYRDGLWTTPLQAQRAAYAIPFMVKTEPYEDMKGAVSVAFARMRAPKAEPKRDPSLSVVAYVHNYAHYLDGVIRSVLAQTYRDYDFYILDDGSTDGTREVVARYLDDPRVRYEFQERKGRARLHETFNRCLEATRGDLVVVCNGNDLMEPTKVERQLEVFRAHPAVDVCYHDMWFIDASGDRLPGETFCPWKDPEHNYRSLGRLTFRDNFVANPTVMFRRAIVDRIGLQEYGWMHDYQFWLKAAVARCRFHYLDEKLLHYRMHEESHSTSSARMGRIVEENRRMRREMRRRYQIDDLYPEIALCEDKARARAAAHVDLGTLFTGGCIPVLDLAISEQLQALAIMPDMPEALNNLGVLLMMTGQQAAGRDCLSRLAARFSDGVVQRNLAAAMDDSGGRHPEYQLVSDRGVFQDVHWPTLEELERIPGPSLVPLPDPSLTRRVATSLKVGAEAEAKGEFAGALAAYEAAAALAPREAEPNLRAGRAAMLTGRVDAAVHWLEQAVTWAPGNADARGLLGVCQQAQGNVAEGVAQLEIAAELKPDDASVLRRLALLHRRTGDLGSAISSYQRLVALPNREAEDLVELARCLVRTKAYGDARRMCNDALRIKPSLHSARELLEVAATSER